MLVAGRHGGGGSLVRCIHLCRRCDLICNGQLVPWLHGYGISVALAFATVVLLWSTSNSN